MIVTNAEAGWVELSATRFMPGLMKTLKRYNTEILSARSAYEPKYPGDIMSWKAHAFMERVSAKYDTPEALSKLNLVSVGDSISEREAAHHVSTETGAKGRVKTVKFVENPDIEQMRRQLMLLTTYLPEICTHPGTFDVNLIC